jgi:type I restriction enzyme R subunit
VTGVQTCALPIFKTAQLACKITSIEKVLFVVDRKDLDYQTMKEYDRFEKGSANSNVSTNILKKQLEEWIRNSLAYAWTNYPQLPLFVRSHAQEMEEEIMRKHITLYVNKFTHSLGEEGQRAIQILFEKYLQLQNKPQTESESPLFV